MSDQDPTPETPVTIGDRLGWFRGDVAAKLTAIGNQITSLLGIPVRSLSELYDKMYDGLFNTSGETHVPAHYVIGTKLDDLSSRIDTIQSVLGAEPYDSTETGNIRAILMTMMLGQSQLTNGIPPVTQANDIYSEGNVGLDGKRYARFTPPINGVTVSENGVDVTAQGSWSGWKAYIQTTAPTIYLNGTPDYPAMWIDLVGSGSYNFAVDAQYTIRVTLRPPYGGISWVFDGTAQIDGAYRANFHNVDGYITVYQPGAPIHISGSLPGWRAENISGSGTVSIIRGEFNSAQNQITVDIPPGGNVLLSSVSRPVTWTWATGPFWLRLTPPT